MVYSGRARAVENHSHKLNALFYYPSVIVLNKYIRKRPIFLSPTRRNIYWRDAYTCQYCGGRFSHNMLTMDHVIPKSRGGLKTWQNIVASCAPCNQRKGSRTPSEASMPLIKVPTQPKFSVVRIIPHVQIPVSWKNYL